MDDVFIDADRLRLPQEQMPTQSGATSAGARPPAKSRRINGEFLRGPIPLNWLSTASGLPGKAPLAVALAIWFERGRRKSNTIILTTAIIKRFGVGRKAKYTGLQALEAAGLIEVQRTPRRNPIVRVLEEANANDPQPVEGEENG
jgi:hypothetical protein